MSGTTDTLNAFLTREEPAVGHAPDGPLAGLTVAVKDIFEIVGQRTGGGNPHKLAAAEPALSTAPSIAALLDAGARFAGRTQTDELTFSLMGQNAHFPEPVNPAATDRVTGGSSSGSAAAVAGGLADIAIGSDTGGSIRAPASFCGLVGLRTSHGAISLEGAMPLAPTLDTFGWFARDMEVYEKVAGVLLAGQNAGEDRAPRLMRHPLLDDLLLGATEADEYARMRALVEEALGPASPVPALSQSIDELYWTFRKIQAFEAWQVHGPFISSGDRQLGPGVKERFEYGASLTKDEVDAEREKREAFRREFASTLGNDGVIVMPTVPGAAPLKTTAFDDIQAYRERALRLLCLSGLSGFPQLTLPLGSIDGAPFGVSLLGPAGSDRWLLGLGRAIMNKAGL
jgi:amidase